MCEWLTQHRWMKTTEYIVINSREWKEPSKSSVANIQFNFQTIIDRATMKTCTISLMHKVVFWKTCSYNFPSHPLSSKLNTRLRSNVICAVETVSLDLGEYICCCGLLVLLCSLATGAEIVTFLPYLCINTMKPRPCLYIPRSPVHPPVIVLTAAAPVLWRDPLKFHLVGRPTKVIHRTLGGGWLKSWIFFRDCHKSPCSPYPRCRPLFALTSEKWWARVAPARWL